jgi:DNA repair protein RecN (Recombination protein N)
MLKTINISNLAVIAKLQLDFSAGLNLLTGETGSGKSIIVDALGLLLGSRAMPEMVRSGETRANVEGVFCLPTSASLSMVLDKAGIEIETTNLELVIRRELTSSGRSRAFINDQLTTVAVLRELQPFLVDIHGQGDQQELSDTSKHIDFLDLFAGLQSQAHNVKQLYERWQRWQQELQQLQRSEAERLRLRDILEFQIAEISRAKLVVDEEEQLETEHRLLANAEKLVSLAEQAYNLLYEQQTAILTQLASVGRKIDDLASVDGRFAGYRESLHSARYSLEDLAYFLRDYAAGINFSPQRLQFIEERLTEIERLKRKYGATVNAVLQTAAEMQTRLDNLQVANSREAELVTLTESAARDYQEVAEQLSQQRQKICSSLETAVMAELAQLAMERASFKVALCPASHPTPHGQDLVEFLATTNPGEDVRSLVKIVSGGEMARLMLALKTITAAVAHPRTLVFDEVDVGIGGRVAEAVGWRLKTLAATNQVLCVTHQPLVARFADSHYQVRKQVVDERTEVKVVLLDRLGRIAEIARMLGGAEITPLTRQHAAELLQPLNQ